MRAAVCLVVAGMMLASCATQRAATAAKAKGQMVGMPKEKVLACMGPPANRAAEGATEVWSYASGGESVGALLTNRYGPAVMKAVHRDCTINVVMTNGAVSQVNYSGNTGALLTKGEQCAYAVEACVQ